MANPLKRVHKDFARELERASKVSDKSQTTITKELAGRMRVSNNIKKMVRDRSGSIQDLAFVMITLFFAAIFFLFVFWIQGQIAGGLAPVFGNVSVDASAPMNSVTTIFSNSMNWIFLALFFSLLIGLVVTAFMTPTHPIFSLISIVILVALVMVSAILSNVYETVSGVSILASSSATLSLIAFVMDKLPIIITIFGVILIVVLYSRSSSEVQTVA